MGSTYQIRVVIFTRYPPLLLVFPRSWPALALQLAHVHLALKWGSIEAVNHLRTSSGISCRRQSVYASAEHQAEHDAAVSQAVQGSCFTSRTEFQASYFQD
jgi:hypothetical protein